MRVSLRQVMRHRRRYIGVVLAIDLGVAGFLNIVTTSREVKKNFNENLDLIGGVTLAFLFAVVIGVGAGLYPSIRASRMEVVTGIRYE